MVVISEVPPSESLAQIGVQLTGRWLGLAVADGVAIRIVNLEEALGQVEGDLGGIQAIELGGDSLSRWGAQ